MKRIAADLLIVFLVLLGGSTRLKAQGLTADRFLDSVSAHPVGSGRTGSIGGSVPGSKHRFARGGTKSAPDFAALYAHRQ